MEMIDFTWWRCLDGYRLELTKPRRWTTRGMVESSREKEVARFGLYPSSQRFEHYEPLKIYELFVIFADTKSTAEGMQAFCNKFGLLGGGLPHLAPLRGKPTSGSVLMDVLLEQHREFQRAVQLYHQGHLDVAANYWNSRHGPATVRTELRVGSDGKVKMVFAPSGLIQAIWLQFALTMCADAKLFRCERCGAPFVVGAGTGRRNTSKFCSNACKVAAFKERQASRSVA
jgi:hypothetical protein